MSYNFSNLEQFLQKQPQCGIPNLELAVAHHGDVVYRRSFGCSDTEGKRPASPNDLYWIFSASKVITCVAAMRLWRREGSRFPIPFPSTFPNTPPSP